MNINNTYSDVTFRATPNLHGRLGGNHDQLPDHLKVTFPDLQKMQPVPRYAKVHNLASLIAQRTCDSSKRSQLDAKDFELLQKDIAKLSKNHPTETLALTRLLIAATAASACGISTADRNSAVGGPTNDEVRTKIRKVTFRMIRQLAGVQVTTKGEQVKRHLAVMIGKRASPLNLNGNDLVGLATGYIHDIDIHSDEMSQPEFTKNFTAAKQILADATRLTQGQRAQLAEKMLMSSHPDLKNCAIDWIKCNGPVLNTSDLARVIKTMLQAIQSDSHASEPVDLVKQIVVLMRHCGNGTDRSNLNAVLSNAARHCNGSINLKTTLIQLSYVNYLHSAGRYDVDKPHAMELAVTTGGGMKVRDIRDVFIDFMQSNERSQVATALAMLDNWVEKLDKDSALGVMKAGLSGLSRLGEDEAKLLSTRLLKVAQRCNMPELLAACDNTIHGMDKHAGFQVLNLLSKLSYTVSGNENIEQFVKFIATLMNEPTLKATFEEKLNMMFTALPRNMGRQILDRLNEMRSQAQHAGTSTKDSAAEKA